MDVMVAGFEVEVMRRLSQELRAAGHMVLGTQGRQSTRTFLHSKVPDVVVVPEEEAQRVREWVVDLGMRLTFVEVPAAAPTGVALTALRQFAGEPEPEPEPDPEPEAADVWPEEPEPEVLVESSAAPFFEAPARLVRSPLGAALPPPLPEVVAPAPRPRRRARVEAPTPIHAVAAEPSPSPTSELDLAPPPLPEEAPVADAPAAAAITGRMARPAAAAPPATPEPHPDLVAKLAQVRFADYFQILEVEPSGSTFQAREAHERLARRFSPRGWSGRLMPEEIDMLDEIARGIADAALVLTDPELRTRYERGLGGPGAPRR